MDRSETELACGAFLSDDGTTSHEYAGHAPGSYESSARAFTYAAIGLIVTILGALVCAWVRA